VLSPLFRGLVLSLLLEAHAEGRLTFFGEHAGLADAKTFKAFLDTRIEKLLVVLLIPTFALE
jgi:hypothetical protein